MTASVQRWRWSVTDDKIFLLKSFFTRSPSFGWNETFVLVILFSVLLHLLLLVSILTVVLLTVVLLGGDITLVVAPPSTSDHLQHKQMTESLVVRRKEGEMTTFLQSCSTQMPGRAVDNFVYKRRKYPPQCCNEIWWGRCNRSLVLRESHRQLYIPVQGGTMIHFPDRRIYFLLLERNQSYKDTGRNRQS